MTKECNGSGWFVEATLVQDDTQAAYGNREWGAHGPLFGIIPEHDEDPAGAGDRGLNMTWGIVFGGVLLLFLVVAVLFVGLGNTYVSQPFTTYPLK